MDDYVNNNDEQNSSNGNKAVPFEPIRRVGKHAAGTAKKVGHGVKSFFRNLFIWISLFAIGFATCFLLSRFGYLPTYEPPILSEEHTTVTIRELGRMIEPAADLVTSRYRYTDADTADTSKQLLGFDVPLTRDMVVFTYSGVVGVGFDLDQVLFDVVEGSGDEKGEITVSLPKLEVKQNEIDENSFEYAYQEHSIFNQLGMDYTTSILADLKKNAQKRALGDKEFMAEARTNAETTIKNFLEAAHVGDYYKIRLVWQDEVGAEQ